MVGVGSKAPDASSIWLSGGDLPVAETRVGTNEHSMLQLR